VRRTGIGSRAPRTRQPKEPFLDDVVIGTPAPRARLTQGIRYMIAGAFFFSVMSLFVKLAGRRLPSQEIVFARSLIMAVICWVALRRRALPPLGTRRGLLVLRSIFGFAALSCFYYALVHLPLADATVIQYTNPVFTALLAVFLLRERLRPIELAGLAVSLAGVLIVARPSFLFGTAARLPLLPVLVALGGAVCSGTAYVLVRKLETEHYLVVIFYFSVLSVLGSFPFLLHQPVLPRGSEWLVLLGVGLSTQAGQVFLTRGLHQERAGRATAATLVQVVFAAFWGVLVFGEVPDAWVLLGSALIIGSVLALGRS
jgi:drug/metabolite transporter (DMT)-like permease